MTTTRHLADLVIRTLDQQRIYFKTRSSEDLILAKGLEKDLRKMAEEVMLEEPGEPSSKTP